MLQKVQQAPFHHVLSARRSLRAYQYDFQTQYGAVEPASVPDNGWTV